MLIAPEDSSDFLRHYKELLTLVAGAPLNGTNDWADARDTLIAEGESFKSRDSIASNPLYPVVPFAVHGKFYFLKRYKKYCAMQHIDSGKFYAVHSLTTPLEEMMPEYCLIEACLYPHRGVILCDGLVRGYNVTLGKNMVSEIREAFTAAKRKGALIHEITVPTNEEPVAKAEKESPARTRPLTACELSEERLRNLEKIPAAELAEFINRMAEGNESVAQLAELFLKRDDPKELASELRGMIDEIASASDFIDYYASDGVARQLDNILDVIERDLIPSDPTTALYALHDFIQSDTAVMDNADDSNGSIGMTYHRACQLLGTASIAAGKAKLAEEIFFDLYEGDDYGTRSRLIDEAPSIFSEDSLQQLIQEWRERTAKEDPKAYGGIGHRLARIAKSIGNPELYEEASLRGQPVDEAPFVALDVAKVYLDCGKPEIALSKIPSERTCPHHSTRGDLLIEIHEALGNKEAVATEYWKRFEQSASFESARHYLDKIPPSERDEASKRMRSVVLEGRFSPLTKATYFARTRDLATAADIIENNADRIEGEYSASLLDFAKPLGKQYPLALSILYRANLNPILDQGSSKYYRHAARHARKLETLAKRITNWKNVTPHQTYWLDIQQKHKRKRRFWEEYDSLAN